MTEESSAKLKVVHVLESLHSKSKIGRFKDVILKHNAKIATGNRP